jgi:hypothetical protein
LRAVGVSVLQPPVFFGDSLMTWGDLWKLLRAYRPDWYDFGFLIVCVLATLGYYWWYDSWKMALIAALSIVMGMFFAMILEPLWWPNKPKKPDRHDT